jgi:exosortase F-associated protein
MKTIKRLTEQTDWKKRTLLALLSTGALLLIFVLQRFHYGFFVMDLLGMSTQVNPEKGLALVLNKLFRFLLNDFFALLLLYAIFYERKYVLFGLMVQVFGLVVFLIPYLYLATQYDFPRPLTSYLHRIVMNPTLLMLLIPTLLYQRSRQQSSA